MKENSFLEF